jgi:hypothetical protein
MPGYLDTLEDDGEQAWARRVHEYGPRALPPDPVAGDNQGYADQADAQADAQAATGTYDPDQLQDKNWLPLNGRFEFEVPIGYPEWARLSQGGAAINDVRHRAWLVPGSEGVVDIQQGVAGTWQVTVGGLTKVNDKEIEDRNIQVFEAMVAGCETGEQRWANAFYSVHTGVVLAGPTEDFDAVGNLGPQLVQGQITFDRKRVGANELRIHGALDKQIVGGYLKQLLDNPQVDYPYRDRSRVKPG